MENRVKILIADGNEEFCGHLKRALEQSGGYEVVGIAGDGEQALCSPHRSRTFWSWIFCLPRSMEYPFSSRHTTWIKRRSRSFYPAS